MFLGVSTLAVATDHGYTIEFLSKETLPENPFRSPLSHSSAPYYFKIENVRQSESALVLFARHRDTNEEFVIKMLREYKDTRYSLESVGKRQKCQLEALQWNRFFTPNFYIGLARVLDWQAGQDFITTDEVIEEPTREMFVSNAEYALVMNRLRDDWRLDCLLCEDNGDLLQCYLQFLTKRVVSLHGELAALTVEDGMRWGSFEQLYRKLVHNLALADPIIETIKDNQYGTMGETFCKIKSSLLEIISQNQYERRFEQRVKEQHIKRCHGDLKAPNIWIAPPSWPSGETWCNVWILDAIDFNPSYCNIDILSDMAMLIVDIQVRTKSPLLANKMIEDYLEYTCQMNETARSVLDYYLVEKAFVGAAITTVYDDSPDLGRTYLEVAEMRMEDLKKWITNDA